MRPCYIALVHHPVRARDGSTVTTAVTNLDVHDLARLARTYEVDGYFVVTPIEAQRELVRRILDHWLEGGGKKRIPERAEALGRVRIAESLEAARDAIVAETGQPPRELATAARSTGEGAATTYAAEAAALEADGPPVLLLFGTGHGLSDGVIEGADGLLPPIAGRGEYNHLSVRAATAITLDRLLGRRNPD